MIANYKTLSNFPPCRQLHPSVRELVSTWIDRLDEEPKELQRGEVFKESWAQGIIASILLGVQIKGFTWTLQETPYKKKGMRGFIITCEYKNTDGLQRITAIYYFTQDKVRVPGEKLIDFIIPWKDRDYPIGGMTFSEIEEKHPGLLNAKFLSRELRVDIYFGLRSHVWLPCKKLIQHLLLQYNQDQVLMQCSN